MTASQPLLDPEVIPRNQYALTNVTLHTPYALAGYARDVRTDAPVFVKTKVGEYGVANLVREADTLRAVAHPQIPRLFQAGANSGAACLVAEAMPGTPLVAKWLERYPSPELTARLVSSMLRPLVYLHDQGWAHRDIKTGNFVTRMTGRAALVDFEMALHRDAKEFQPEGRVWADVDYIAPERAQGDRGDLPADVYSMGVVMYELLYGRLPFKASGLREVAVKHCIEPLDLSKTFGRPVPKRLAYIVCRATQKDPAHRYDSARSMQEELAAYLRVTQIS